MKEKETNMFNMLKIITWHTIINSHIVKVPIFEL